MRTTYKEVRLSSRTINETTDQYAMKNEGEPEVRQFGRKVIRGKLYARAEIMVTISAANSRPTIRRMTVL